jgi:lipopolysaccharide transport system ATP-binding protein
MSSGEIAVQARGVSKKFSRSLGRSIWYGIQDVSRNLIGLQTRSQTLRPDEFWAVEDVSFDLHRGEIMGLIGPNGSGKSTTLKMLNGIFMPDVGEIEIRGKVGALIDVGVGFHPMLTGRENIYVSGAVHGMTRRQIDGLLDEIIAFSEVEAFIDTPVKYYSSGMYVRLGFSVAIHLNPDVLLIDEVLSVGDMAFSRKCFQKIEAVLNSGITVIFVSHAIRHVERICQKAVLLHKGKVEAYGEASDVTKQYYALANNLSTLDTKSGDMNLGQHSAPERFKVLGVEILNEEREISDQHYMMSQMVIRVRFEAYEKMKDLNTFVRLYSIDGINIVSISSIGNGCSEWIGPGTCDCVIPELLLREGVYTVGISLSDQTFSLFRAERAAEFSVIPDESVFHRAGSSGGMMHIPASWQFHSEEQN